MNTIDQLARKLEPGILIDLYTLHLSAQGGTDQHIHPHVMLGVVTLVFQGLTYQPLPITSEGWDFNPQGPLPRPILRIANIDSQITALLQQWGDFVGCQVTRRRTYAEFLDVNPDGSVNPTANPLMELPPEIFVVERKTAETNTVVEFELATVFDAEGVSLPRRQILPSYCSWLYRSPECEYVGPPVADIHNEPIVATTYRGRWTSGTTYVDDAENTITLASGFDNEDYVYVLVSGIRVYYASLAATNTSPLTDETKWVRDACQKTVGACKLRFGADNPLPFGNFPGSQDMPR